MATNNPPRKNVAYRTFICLNDYVSGDFKANPTIAAGDFKVSIDGGALANLATLPSVAPAASIWVQIDLSASEMNGDAIKVQCIDQTAPQEWQQNAFVIQTTA